MKIELSEEDIREMAYMWVEANFTDKDLTDVESSGITLTVGKEPPEFVGADATKESLGDKERDYTKEAWERSN